MNVDVFAERKANTERVISDLRRSLYEHLGKRAVHLIGEHTCVYATGSCGRGELGAGSDLDAYLVRVTGDVSSEGAEELESAVALANAAAGLPKLDGGGRYLKMASASQLLDLLGSPEDDSEGVLTKRVLLLLESRVLVGEDAHRALIDQVIDAYWSNEDLHPEDYLPFMLVNDIVRYWRIVLLNHESKLRKRKYEIEQEPGVGAAERAARLLAERRHRSYKLRLPRCLTCFSALTYLLALTPTEPAHVDKDAVRTMIGLTPIERLRVLPEIAGRDLPRVQQLLDVYRSYLERTNVDKSVLLDQLQRNRQIQEIIPHEGRTFTRLMFELVQELGGGRPLHRHMLV